LDPKPGPGDEIPEKMRRCFSDEIGLKIGRSFLDQIQGMTPHFSGVFFYTPDAIIIRGLTASFFIWGIGVFF
jgi:hypothetical protein